MYNKRKHMHLKNKIILFKKKKKRNNLIGKKNNPNLKKWQ